MTQTIEQPEAYVEIAIEIIPAGCTRGLAWCEGDCTDADPYHRAAFAFIPGLTFTARGWVETSKDLDIRFDENEGDSSRPLILLDTSTGMTANQARIAAAHLLNAADVIDPLPVGVTATVAAQVRIGDELLTEDGWQKVIGLAFFADTEQASIFTPERGGDADGTDGWDLSFNDPVKVRRALRGCAVQFVEPIPGGVR